MSEVGKAHLVPWRSVWGRCRGNRGGKTRLDGNRGLFAVGHLGNAGKLVVDWRGWDWVVGHWVSRRPAVDLLHLHWVSLWHLVLLVQRRWLSWLRWKIRCGCRERLLLLRHERLLQHRGRLAHILVAVHGHSMHRREVRVLNERSWHTKTEHGCRGATALISGTSERRQLNRRWAGVRRTSGCRRAAVGNKRRCIVG